MKKELNLQNKKVFFNPFYTIDKNAKNTIGEEVRETSLGSRLMSAGMEMVVAMGYSVTVTAAKLMMEHLYKHLFLISFG